MAAENTLLGRIEAAELLGISTRTLDRYVKARKLNPIRKKGKIFFEKGELRALNEAENAHNPQVISEKKEVSVPRESEESRKYKTLWEATRQDLQDKEQLIFQLQHRLGYLEAELKNSVPLLESQNQQQQLEENFQKQSEKIRRLSTQLRHHKLVKIIFMVLFGLAFIAGIFVALSFANS